MPRPDAAELPHQPQLPGEPIEPLLGRPEEQLGLLRARGVAVELVLDDVAGAAVQLVRRRA